MERRPSQSPQRPSSAPKPGRQQNSADKPSLTIRPASTGPTPKK